MPGYQIAYGGVPAAEVAGGRLSARPYAVGVAAGAYVLAGGPDWVDEPPKCVHLMKETGWPCPNAPLKGADHCIGHKRAALKEQQKKAE